MLPQRLSQSRLLGGYRARRAESLRQMIIPYRGMNVAIISRRCNIRKPWNVASLQTRTHVLTRTSRNSGATRMRAVEHDTNHTHSDEFPIRFISTSWKGVKCTAIVCMETCPGDVFKAPRVAVCDSLDFCLGL